MAIERIVLLVGGVGGAKLALGLAQIIPPQHLTIIINTGDDFLHYGLHISPDIDTVMYTLAGIVDPVNGWGIADDSVQALDALARYGETPWFKLGDKDIATHLLRTHLLRTGHSLTVVTQRLSRALGIEATLLPMTDDPVATIARTTTHGDLGFQDYFVRHRWQPVVQTLIYQGAERAKISAQARTAIAQADAILIGPSNPWLSIAPILAIGEMRDALCARDVPRVAITPIIQGRAIKGPAAKIMAELGYDVSVASVLAYYETFVNGFVYDERDSAITHRHIRTIAMDTVMNTTDDKVRVAQAIINWIGGWPS